MDKIEFADVALIAAESEIHKQFAWAAFSQDISHAFIETDSIECILQKCAIAMIDHLDGALARIWTFNKKENVLELRASAGMYTHVNGPHGRIPFGKFKIGIIAQQRKPHLTNQVIGDSLISDQEWARSHGIVSFAGHPLVIGQEVVGVIGMFAQKRLPDSTLAALASVADWIALGIMKNNVEKQQLKHASELREQAELLDLTHDTIMVLDMNGIIIFWNKGGEEMYGFTKQEAVGKAAHALLRTVFPKPYKEINEQLLREGRWEGELIHTGKSGKAVTASSRWSLKRNARGEPAAILEINNDRSEQRKAEQALRESEERWQLALRGNNDGIWDWNLRTNAVFFSSRWKHMLGFNDDEIQNHVDEWSKRVHPEDLPFVMQAIQDHLAKKTPYYVTEHRVLCKDGSYKWVLDRGQALWDEHGNAVRMTGSHTDISERIRTEVQLRESEARTRALLQAIPDLMLRASSKGLCLEVIPPKETSLKLNAGDFHGKNIADVLPGPIAEKAMHFVNLALKTGETQFFEFEFIVNSKVLDYEARIVRSAEEEVLFILRDISQRKEAERMKSEFIAIVSHELRTPLTSIMGSLELIGVGLLGELSTEIKEMVDIAQFNAERLLNLINDILDIEKIESGKMSFHFTPLELVPLIEKAISATRNFARRIDVNFELQNRLGNTKVYADEGRLMQVMINLLSNAAKYSPPNDRVIIALSINHGEVRVSVEDHGPGIAEEFRSRIFQKFVQADSSDSRKIGGSGLGLTISKAIIDKHGGTIGFQSEPNKGTIFYFQLAEWKQAPARVITETAEVRHDQ
jgi:PAS domain S-box-containing protein